MPNASEFPTLPSRPWRLRVTPGDRILNHPYAGEGTDEKPFVVGWLPDDVENPMSFRYSYKWIATMIGAVAVLAVTMASSMLSAALFDIEREFPGKTTQEYILVTSIFVLSFVVGPLLWAPCSEIFGRRKMFIFTYLPFTAFNAGVCGAKSLEVLLVLRFFAGMFGSSPLTSAGGVIADMFPADQRGLAMGIFAAAPFLGPAIGPVAGGFLAEAASWKWVAAVIACFAALLTILGTVFSPETYAPVLLRQRAARLAKFTGKVYIAQPDAGKPKVPPKNLFANQMKKPWELLFKEPIVLLMALYMAIIYAILYMQFTSFPIVFQRARGWSPGIAGLAFVGITIGAFASLGYIVLYENKRYAKKMHAAGGYLAPEQRLPSVIGGSVLLPAGLFIFAWTGTPVTIPWIAPLIGTVLFGAGLVLVFLGIMNYLVDAYLIYAASVLAGNTIVRSIFGVVFPLFTSTIYANLGIHWAGTLIACLAVLFMPAPLIFYLYGARIRRASRYSREADDFGKMMAEKVRAMMLAKAQGANAPVPGTAAGQSAEVKSDLAREEEAVEALGEELHRATTQTGAGDAVATKLEQVEELKEGEARQRA
ncbi:hypothetical protein EHS25_009572 [Saitozyma podzolica]|uniref:Major facilitator superfamily (MFS) profile domain-containing protein n=1 Tax=Saitozyma podzolica TaxID=1890683 RepID=A0A427YJM3_9TREE|nr:hypothetical protein EHS25_009572 [Saitozyma podzolica]